MVVTVGSCWEPLPDTGGRAIWCVQARDGDRVWACTVRPDGSFTKTKAKFDARYLASHYRRVRRPAESGAQGAEPPCDEGKETRDAP